MKLWHVYVLIGIVAFFATWSQVFPYFASLDVGPVAATEQFWRDALTGGPVSRFLAYDLVLLAVAVYVLMWVEARKVGIGTGWLVAYIVLSTLVGISTFVPFFLAHRQRILDARTAD